MKVTLNIFRYLGLSLFLLSTAQASQISDEECYLLNLANIMHDEYKDDENNENDQNELDKAFLEAAKKGDVISLKELKEKGAKVDATDEDDNNALHLAVMFAPNSKSVEWLIDTAKIDIESKDYYEMTPFLMAAQKDNLDTLKLFKKKGAEVDATDEDDNNALHLAISNDVEFETIEWLVNHIDLEAEGKYQKTPFLYAAEKGNLDVLKLLKNKGAKVDAIDENDNNALHLAISNDVEFETIEWFVNHTDIDLDHKNYSQKTPFLYAAEQGNLDVLKLLKNKGAKVDATDKSGYNALSCYVRWNKIEFETTEWLVNHTDINLDSKDYYQKSPFLYAAEQGNLDVLKLLKNNGAKVDVTDESGYNALSCYVRWNKIEFETIEWFVNHTDIDLDSKDYYQKSPFLYAAQQGNLDVLKLLKNNGAKVDATDNKGNNALHLATLHAPNGKGIKWLILTAKIDTESQNGHQKIPFLIAAQEGNLDALKILRNNGANVNATDNKGNNALHYAALAAPNGKVIEWLILTAKIDTESKNEYQVTPFLMAAEKGNLDTLKILRNKGADVNATDKSGNNALHYAAMFAPEGKGIEWLILTAKIDTESQEGHQKTPFFCAAEKGNLDALKILKNNGANVNATDKSGNNALHFAAVFAPNGKGIEWLIHTAKIDIESKGNSQATPFLLATQRDNPYALKILKNNGANINATNENGNNALHLAAMFAAPNGKSIEWLILTAKIDIESKNNNKKTPFLCAAENGNINALNILRNKGANVNATDQYGYNAIHYAICKELQFETIEWLVNHTDIDLEHQITRNEKTPFLCAAQKGNLDALKLLKNNGANVNATDQYGNNAIYLAICKDVQFETIEWLVNQADIDLEHQIPWNRKTSFLMAAEKGNLNLLKLLKNKGAYVNAIDQYGHNAIYWAICKNLDFQVFQWLVNHTDIDLDHQITWDQKTPFLCAAEKGNLDALKLLKKKGAKVDATDKGNNNALHLAAGFAPEGKGIEWLIHIAKIDIESKGYYQMTPFLCAAEKGNLDALKLLKKKGAHVNATDKYGDNALHWAIWKNAPIKCIQWLIHTAKIDINSQGYKQRTSFLYAAEKGNLGLLKFLKNKGADVNATDKNGGNALHWAIWKNAPIKCIQWLIHTAKIDIDSKGYKQKNSFLSAAKKGNLDVLKLLKNNGAHVFAADEDGNNALYYAKKNNDQNIIKWLQEVCGLIKEHVDNINAS